MLTVFLCKIGETFVQISELVSVYEKLFYLLIKRFAMSS